MITTPEASEAARSAERMREIEPFHVMDLLAEARKLEAAGRDIVHMEVGEPDFPTAQPIVDAATRALATERMAYTPAVGIAPLRERISRFYAERLGIDVPARRIILTPGASGALLLITGVLVDRDSRILLADPGYPCNRHFVRLMEGSPVGIYVGPETDYQLTPELVERHWDARTRGVLVGSPSNPTGTIMPDDSIRELAGLTARRGGHLIMDEIYHGLVYEGSTTTALAFSNDIFVVNSFSKYFGMTGWRLGWVVAPEQFVRDIDKLAQNVFLAPPTIAQHAAMAAFEPATIEILEKRREEFRRRRDFLLPALRSIGFQIDVEPRGAFYLYANVERFTSDSYAFARDVLEHAGVAITPGIDFGSNAPAIHVRFAYTTTVERLEEGVERLRSFLRAGS